MSKKAKRLSKSTCLHCVFFKAVSAKWKGRGKTGEAKADMIASTIKIVQHAMLTMTPEEQAQFLKDINEPQPTIINVLDAIKSALENGGMKVTEH